MRIVPLASALLVSFAACQPGQASAEAPRSLTPTVDVEIEDHPDASAARVSRFSLALIDGRAELTTRDADAKVAVLVKPLPGGLSIDVKRSGRDDLEVGGAIPDKPSGRVLVARVERPSGASTSVIARVR